MLRFQCPGEIGVVIFHGCGLSWYFFPYPVARSDSVLFLFSFVSSATPPCFVSFRQGETDGAKENRAQTYYERFEILVQDIRGLGYPDLKIFTVAVTGSNGRLSYLQQVRVSGVLRVFLPIQFAVPFAVCRPRCTCRCCDFTTSLVSFRTTYANFASPRCAMHSLGRALRRE